MLVKVNVRLSHELQQGAVVDMPEDSTLDTYLKVGWVTDVSTVDSRLKADGHSQPEPEPEPEHDPDRLSPEQKSEPFKVKMWGKGERDQV